MPSPPGPTPGASPAAPAVARRWNSLLWILSSFAVVAVVTMVPWNGECGFRFALGAPCPGCGMTRSMAALLRGDLPGSLRMHPLGLPLLLAAVAGVALAVHEGVTRRPTFRRVADHWGARLAIAGLLLLGAVWLVRVVLHPAWSPDPLRPGSVAERVLGGGN